MFKVPKLCRCNIPVAVVVLAATATGSISLSGTAQAAGCRSSHSPDLTKILSFAEPPRGKLPGGWGSNLPETAVLSKTTHKGQKALLISRDKKSASKFSDIESCVQSDFSGKTITLKGLLRTSDVSKFAGLWLREDGDSGVLILNNMQDRNLHGTTGWKEYSVSVPVKPQARRVIFGALLAGTGKVRVSHLRLLVDGKPVWQAPKAKLKKTVLDTDHEFDTDSGIHIKALNKVQTANLVTLGKVWGFLKYYDPTVTAGKRQWDYDLFRIMPAILKAKSRKDANAALVQWIKKLGSLPPCKSCIHLKTKNLQLRPDLGWIHDSDRLGKRLSGLLERVYENRTGKQFYVALTKVGNPRFQHELPYKSIEFPDSGFQLLALYRFWNMIEYWYPYRNVIGPNWNHVLAEFIPRLALAKSFKDYTLQLMQLVAEVHDSHANLWSSIKDRPPVGPCHLPVRIRYVQARPVVTAHGNGKQTKDSPFRVGDVLVKLDGQPISKLFKQWAPYYGAPNKAALRRQIATFMTRGACGAATVTIRRDNDALRIKTTRVPIPGGPNHWSEGTRDLSGPTFRLLSPKVAYVKLSSIKSNQVASYIKRAQGTKGLIIDIRNYPSQFVVFSLGSRLVNKKTPFVRFTSGDLHNPGAFYWESPLALTPGKPHYAGKVVILVDGVTQSSAEYTAMAFRATPGAIVVGSQTAGADGNISLIPFPGGLSAAMSGLGIFYPDKKPTQRIGIVPDVVVKPTIADIRAGRDAVLEKAIRLIVGPKVPEAKIRKMYQTPPTKL